MSVYNGDKYLNQAIDSILNQTFSNFEFIIINDNSSDRTEEILKSYSDKRIKIIRNTTNLGLTKSLNKGLAESKGEYIARMDCDDISMPNRFEIQNKFLDENKEIVCVGSSTLTINGNSEVVGKKDVETDPEAIAFQMLIINQMTHSSVMMRADIIKKENYYNENYRYTQDYELWSRLILHNYKLSNIKSPLLKYRYHQNSITQDGKSRNDAYALAISTTRRNIENYIKITDKQFYIFTQFFHKYTIKKIFNLLTLEILIFIFTRSYINIKKGVKSEAIWEISRKQMIRAIKCYCMYILKVIKIK